MATSSTQATASRLTSIELKPHFMEKLMNKICCFYYEQSLVDVTFKVSNPESFVPAHRLILSAASAYFENLFNGDRGNNPVIEINDIDSDIFEHLITFCYTGQLLVTVDNVAALLKAAIVLELEDAATACVEYLMSHIDECTLQGVYALERETQCELLTQKIHEYEIQHFMEISQSVEFLNFDVERFQCLLESDHLNIACEKDAFDAITRWFNHNVSARREHIPLLISCLRLTQFDVDFLLTHIQKLPGCETLALKASIWIKEPTARTIVNIRFTEPRIGVSTEGLGPKTLLAISKNKYTKANCYSQCVLQYNKTEDKWQEYASINSFDMMCSAVLKDDNILYIGGCRSPSKNVLSWNIRNKTCQELPAMNQARQSPSVVELYGKIYAIGGIRDDKTSLQSVERYTTSSDWAFVKPLITARHNAGVVALNGKIYVVGGYNQTRLKSVECYNPDSNKWTSCADLIDHHSWISIAAHNGHIYVSGGSGNLFRPVERYDPQRDTWTKICSLNGNKSFWPYTAFASLDNKLWNIGGTASRDNKTSVTVYDEEHDNWLEKKSFPSSGIYSCFVVPLALLASENSNINVSGF